MDDKKNVYITLHKNFVHEGIEYEDRKTGETKTFNSVTLPKGTVVNGQDVSYSQFSPLFVNPSRFKGENYRDIPLLAEKEVWLKKSVLEPDGSPTLDEDGKQVREVIKVMPAALKEGIDKGRAAYLASLDDKAKEAREASANQTREARQAEPVSRQAVRHGSYDDWHFRLEGPALPARSAYRPELGHRLSCGHGAKRIRRRDRLVEHRGQDPLRGIHDHMDVRRWRDGLLREPLCGNAAFRHLHQKRYKLGIGPRCGDHSGPLVQLR